MEADPMNDGILCQLTLQCSVAPKVEYHDCWGLIDNDQFVLIHANDKAAWVECGRNAIPITLENDEIATVRHAPGAEPDEVLVALARYRLTGETAGFVNEELQND
jgi:hypothetical protein